ncbi:low affinity iron permease family protein [Adhaeribacter radiodurans]|uniref:Low affinity iron permease family protein n=1 Tax=Adhaeribacter radiodurans TaxID=2745197 RepID=A0A7L7L855_9BACT|nr:low affinity iron permease family protein [Adhaeribacter radiodurans]QMU28943.1 low affinity iron permease family protein [Adhaeribacter radiodurans]
MENIRNKKPSRFTIFFEKFASQITCFSGKPISFLVALGFVLVWGITGPLFKFSDTWQLVINTVTSIVTFLMVFLIQQSQNKDSQAIQLKLNEVVAALKGASNRLINIEDLSDEELKVLKSYYDQLSDIAEKEESIVEAHSMEDARENQKAKEQADHKPQ